MEKERKFKGEMKKAWEAAGWRERFAIDNGNKTIVYANGHKCLRFTYSRYKEYQDANGAIYDTVTKQWIGQKGRLKSMKVKYVGFGGQMEVPCYEDENGKLYFDENNGENGLNLYTGAYRTEWDEICGEPCNRVTEPVECDDPFVRHPREKDYMLLDRMRSDCNYFLGNGNGYEGHLWGGSVEAICDEMERIWNSLEEKPEWLTLEQIKEYRKEMMKVRMK